MELLCSAPPAGPHLDVGGPGHHRSSLHALPGALCRLRLGAGPRRHHRALRLAAGGEYAHLRHHPAPCNVHVSAE